MNIAISVNGRFSIPFEINTLEEFTAAVEYEFLKESFEQHKYNQFQTAKALGMNRGTFRKKLELYGLLK